MNFLSLTREQEIELVRAFSVRNDEFIPSTLDSEVEKWCEDNLKSIPTVSIEFIENEHGVEINTLVYFSSEIDTILFKMRWL